MCMINAYTVLYVHREIILFNAELQTMDNACLRAFARKSGAAFDSCCHIL